MAYDWLQFTAGEHRPQTKHWNNFSVNMEKPSCTIFGLNQFCGVYGSFKTKQPIQIKKGQFIAWDFNFKSLLLTYISSRHAMAFEPNKGKLGKGGIWVWNVFVIKRMGNTSISVSCLLDKWCHRLLLRTCTEMASKNTACQVFCDPQKPLDFEYPHLR